MKPPANPKMRLLLATFSFPPNKDGVAEASAACAQALRAHGWAVDVATAGPASLAPCAEGQGINLHHFDITGTGHVRHPFQGQLALYRQFLLSGCWDIIFFEGYSWPLTLAVPLFDQISARKVVVSHGYGALVWTPVPRFPFGLGALTFSVIQSLKMLHWIRKVDRWVFLSPRADLCSFYDHWLGQKIHHPGIRVIPNGLNPNQRGTGSRFREACGIPADVLVFLCVGYFSRGKNQRFALEAYRDAAVPNSRLVFIAPESNEWMDKCRDVARHVPWSAAHQGVIWLTGQSRESTLDAFAGCDIYLSASTGETQPITLLEAMREAKPWIAMKAGCIPELPGGRCVASRRAMARAIQRLASDRRLCAELGQSGQEAVASKYSAKNFEKAYGELVMSLVNQRS